MKVNCIKCQSSFRIIGIPSGAYLCSGCRKNPQPKICFDEKTLEECRDWLAEQQEFTWIQYEKPIERSTGEWRLRGEVVARPAMKYGLSHPVPATIDEAAKLPRNSWWHVEIRQCGPQDFYKWYAKAIDGESRKGLPQRPDITGSSCESEILARFRLRCKIESLGCLK